MNIAITGGTGFVGGHLAQSLTDKGHNVVLIARGLDMRNESIRHLKSTQFKAIGTSDEKKLFDAFKGCDAIAHCAGINRESNPKDYTRIHIEGTQNVINAAKQAGVKKVILISFYSARPNCGSKYHESKYAAEEIVRNSGLDYTIFKPGMIYGKGDHMLDHLTHVFYTLPFFALVGFREQHAAPLAIDDFVKILEVSLLEDRLSKKTLPVIGPEKMTLEEAVTRVAKVVDRTPIIFPMPIFFHYGFAVILERLMTIPLVSIAQVRILAEGFDKSYGNYEQLPLDLQPQTTFTEAQIRKGLPELGPFGLHDLKCWSKCQ